MTDTAFCPACASLPASTLQQAVRADHATYVLSLPGIHCVACINGVEQTLLGLSGVSAARVNLSLKRATVTADHHVTPESLIEALEHAGFEARPLDQSLLGNRRDTVGRTLLMRIAIAGFALMNVMLLSVAVWSGAIGATQSLFHILSAAIAVPALLYAAQPFFHNALIALRGGRLNMDVPISLAIILAGSMSTYESLYGGAHAYFDAALSLTFFLLLGRYLEHRSRSAAVSAAAQLAALDVPRVQLVHDGGRTLIDFAQLKVGETIAVLPGGRIPVDGVVVQGAGAVDRSMLTGETRLGHVTIGDYVTAGEVSNSSLLHIQADTVGQDTTLRRMVSMVDEAETVRNTYNAIADRAAKIYAPLVHVLALVAFLGWLLVSGDARFALNIAIAVLIITCPCALGLAVPAVSTTAAGRLFQSGLLVKDGTALERIAEIDTVVFDKTGTLTLPDAGSFGASFSMADKQVLLGLAASSSHPVSKAIARALDNITPATVTDIQEIAGRGLSGMWNGHRVRLGAMDWLGVGTTGTGLQIGNRPPAPLDIAATLRDGAQDLVKHWQTLGLDLHILSGDATEETKSVADRLGVSQWQAGTSPSDKIAYIKGLTHAGKKVLMIGDGLNDTGALACAFASISPASAADSSRAASDIVLLQESLLPLRDVPAIARAAKRRILENFTIAAGYNAIAIPIAFAGFATPLAAAIAMSGSSIMVVLNALRMKGRV